MTTISLVVALGFIVRNANLGASGSESEVKASMLEKSGCKLEPCANLDFASSVFSSPEPKAPGELIV